MTFPRINLVISILRKFKFEFEEPKTSSQEIVFLVPDMTGIFVSPPYYPYAPPYLYLYIYVFGVY